MPRRPTETVLYGLVREHLEPFLVYAREHYDSGLPSYVEAELRAYLKCGVFAEGFTRAHCDSCGHDLLVAFSCHGRSICPSCCGRRMANTAAHLVDRVLPDVPVRQYVLTLPYELRKLAAFKADVLTALARIFVESVFIIYRARAKREGVVQPQCGSINFVQRFGSLNLHVHFHVVVLDGVFAKDAAGRVLFRAAPPPQASDLEAIVARTARLSTAWLRRHGYLDESPLEARSNEPLEQTALDACAAIAMGRGTVATLARDGQDRDDEHKTESDTRSPTLAVERHGFNVHAGVRIAAGDDLGRERLCRYGARPPLSLERLRRLPGGRVGYRLKYVDRGRRGKHRVMTAMEFMARLAAIIAPPRYPLLRYGGVLAPRSGWRKLVIPRPREDVATCKATGKGATEATKENIVRGGDGASVAPATGQEQRSSPQTVVPLVQRGAPEEDIARSADSQPASFPVSTAAAAPVHPPQRGDVILLAPNVIAVKHWNRLLGGLLYAVSPRVDWATLLRRSFQVDVLECPKCHGRLRVLAVITEREPVQRILAHLGLPTEAPPLARARDPTEDDVDERDHVQLSLGLS